MTCSFSFNVDEMFRINEQLTGHTFSYDGNPHEFGKAPPKRADVQSRLAAASAPPPPEHIQPTHVPPTTTTNAVFAAFTFDTTEIMACVK
ncbi:hypothetical protein B5M09_006427 [Aphanomyces astaci]|nr:hypothetical protein B5M09_006427 [Aphanomyces astaci]